MPAMPIADSNPPLVVGMRQTSNASRITEETVGPGARPTGPVVATVRRNGLRLGYQDVVAFAQVRGRNDLLTAVANPTRGRLLLGGAQRICLSFAACLRHGLGKVGEEDRKPEPQGDLQREADVAGAR